jgi:hypothetical protein
MIALMSGAWLNSDLQRAKELGCQAFHKPFLLDEIKKWLDDCEKRINRNSVLSDWFSKEATITSLTND